MARENSSIRGQFLLLWYQEHAEILLETHQQAVLPETSICCYGNAMCRRMLSRMSLVGQLASNTSTCTIHKQLCWCPLHHNYSTINS